MERLPDQIKCFRASAALTWQMFPRLRRGTFKRKAMMAVCVEREPRSLRAIWKVAEEHRGREENIC